jgi:hypothetical protein
MTDVEKLKVALKALEDIIREDGQGADLSPPGPCYGIAKKALDEINRKPTKEEILSALRKPHTYPNTRLYPGPSPRDFSQGKKVTRGLKK